MSSTVVRHALVLTMDDARTVLQDADVLVVDDRIAEVGGPGQRLSVPEGTEELDASGGILMPGMVDTHRHLWQTAMRAYGADWTLTQYFVWYYLEHGVAFRPEDVATGNALSALDALDAGVTTTVDWSHGLRTTEHAEAAIGALAASPGRFVFAPGNIFGAPWEWANSADFRAFMARHREAHPRLGFQLAFDVTGDPAFPEKAAYEAAREMDLSVTTHAGVWGATNDEGIRLAHEHGLMRPGDVYVHAATLSDDSYQRIAATGGTISLSTESEQSCGQGYPPAMKVREHGIGASLSVDTSVWFSSDLFAAMRSTLGADRAWEHTRAHETGGTVTHSHLRAEQVVEWATRGGARALGLDGVVGQVKAGLKADLVLLKNDHSPSMFPVLNPYGHVVFQVGRGDVHTVLVDGAVVKRDGRLVGADLAGLRAAAEGTVEHLRSSLGEEVWQAGMNPEVPQTEILDNPYQYTEYRSAATHSASGA